jgi:hypothetical protein
MSDWNQLEKELQSWIPRPPSGKIEQRLFPKPIQNDGHALTFSIWSWLAPALCTLVLTFTLWLSHNEAAGHLAISFVNSNLLASLPDHKALPGLASDRQCQEWNLVSATLDLTRLSMPERSLLTFITPAPLWRGGNDSSATFDWTKTNPSLSITGSFPAWKTNIEKL